MCLPSVIVAGLSLFTYTWLLLLPVLGIIFGIHTFCTISLVVVSALLISHLIPGIVRWIFPIIDLAVLSVAVIIPLALIPEWVTDLYLLLFAFLEPVLLVVEVIQVVSAIRSTGLFAQQGISEQPTFWKGTVLFSTLISWVFSVSILLCNPEFGNLLFLLCLLNIFAHAITVWADEGIISDSALVLLASSCYLWLGSLEQDISAIVCSSFGQRPEGEADAATLLGGILSLPYISLAAPLATVTSLREVTRPSFWLGIALRVLSAFFVTKQLFLRRKNKWDDSDDEDDGGGILGSLTSFGGRLAVRTACLFAYSQAVWRLLGGCASTVFQLGRQSQAFLTVLVYVFQLHLSRESEDFSY